MSDRDSGPHTQRLPGPQLEGLVLQRTRQLVESNRQLVEVHQRLIQLAGADSLTGLANRATLRQRLQMEVERCQRSSACFSLLLVDLDGLDRYNDDLGQAAGDELLKSVASTLARGRRINDLVARRGSDEFAIILAGADRYDAAVVGDRLRRRVAAECRVDDGDALSAPTISVGVATCPDDASTVEALIAAADRALLEAKRDGGDRVELGCTCEAKPRSLGGRRPAAPTEPTCVLIAEDDDELRQLLAARLTADGYRVIEARNGTELLDHLGSMRLDDPDAPRVDLIVSDIRMPGWSGLQVLEGLRGIDWAPPVILMTAYADAEAHRSALQLGAAATFEKPFDICDLSTAILNYLPGRQPARGAATEAF